MSWKKFIYKSGGNPYITTADKEFKRIMKKYNGKVNQINKDTYLIDDIQPKNDLFDFSIIF